MLLTRIECRQFIPIGLDEAWEFFSNPRNLKRITPEEMKFNILSGGDGPMYQGMVIQYTVTPLLGIQMPWVTEITHVDYRKYFVDEQRFGPYSLWHHLHRFEEVTGGVVMTDILHYRIPLGPVGKLLGILFINKKVNSIFDYRIKVLDEIFPKENKTVMNAA
ncbi:MAG: SRPBCC family protein [Flavobacteriales bacterium]|nr:SRPBCC family protein [Flavobacteriales bacterium]